ncbi:MAG: dihydrodipicolinate reductase C-terminal domain-containing protein [Gemmatimonadales bacterium]
MKLAIIGHGRMGQAISRLATARGHSVVATVSGQAQRDGGSLTAERLAGAEVVLEFTRPESAVGNLLGLARLGARVVSGTTGWTEALPRIQEAFLAGGGALIHSANFSLGVQLFLRAAGDLARQFAGRPEFAAYVTEIHHAAKRDAPSGTARILQERLRRADAGREFPISSTRAGFGAGTHAAVFDTEFETIHLTHETRSRDVFAAGALSAAEWLPGRRGVFTLDQMLFGEGP